MEAAAETAAADRDCLQWLRTANAYDEDGGGAVDNGGVGGGSKADAAAAAAGSKPELCIETSAIY